MPAAAAAAAAATHHVLLLIVLSCDGVGINATDAGYTKQGKSHFKETFVSAPKRHLTTGQARPPLNPTLHLKDTQTSTSGRGHLHLDQPPPPPHLRAIPASSRP